MTLRNVGPNGQVAASPPQGPPPQGPTRPTGPIVASPLAQGDAAPENANAGAATSSVSLVDDPTDPPTRPAAAPGAVIPEAVSTDLPPAKGAPRTPADPAAGPHNPLRPEPGVTQDRYGISMRRGYFQAGFNRQSNGGSFHLGALANQRGGGAILGGMVRTPLGEHLSLSWGGELEATVQKFGDLTMVQVNPDILGRLEYSDSHNQFSLNGGLNTRVAVGWDQRAARGNRNEANALADKIEREFESLKAKLQARVNEMKELGQAFLQTVQNQLPPARDRFAQLLSERVQRDLGAAGQRIAPIITREVGAAFGAYMASLSSIIGNMADAMQRASTASTPRQMQSAMADFASNLAALQAATAPGSLDPYMAQLQDRLVAELGPEGATAAAAIGASIQATSAEVGTELLRTLQATAQDYLARANGVLTEMFGDAAAALGNSADAVENAQNNYQQMTTVAVQSRVGIGAEYTRVIDPLSSRQYDFATTVTVGGNYYHPLWNAELADSGAPNPFVVQQAQGATADWHAGVGFSKWWGAMGVGATAGYRGTYTGGGVTHSPEFMLSFNSRFLN